MKVFIFFLISLTCLSKDKSFYSLFGGGPVWGVNESAAGNRNLGFGGRLGFLYSNLPVDNFSTELAYNFSYDNQTDQNPFKTSINQFDLKFRYEFQELLDIKFNPYVFLGGGYMFFETESPNIQKISDSDFLYNFGAGFSYQFNDKWGLSFAITSNVTNNDKINPVIDEINDAYWTFNMQVSYNFGDIFGLNSDDELADVKTFSVSIGEPIILSGLTFDRNSSRITPDSYPVLLSAYKTLRDNPDWEVSIEGHTDNSGNPDLNSRLSGERAEAVKTFLITKGIAKKRLKSAGFGSSKPKLPNTSDENRAQNRRIELIRTK